MGGAIAWMLSTVTVEGCIFTNNTAEDYSIVYVMSGAGQITTSVFTNNRANAIVSVNGATCNTINNSIFLNNNGTIFKIDYESNTNYNWFGHTESNYKDDYGIMQMQQMALFKCNSNSRHNKHVRHIQCNIHNMGI